MRLFCLPDYHYDLSDALPLQEQTTSIAPGSRPLSKFDDDPTVCCADNPYPDRCKHLQQASLNQRQYSVPYRPLNNSEPQQLEAIRLPCIDFLNYSDSGLLWWQALQREATFTPRDSYFFIDDKYNGYVCPDDEQINFYLVVTDNSPLPYVDLRRGGRLSRCYDERSAPVAICLVIDTDHPSTDDESTLANIIYSFVYCLRHYGEGIEKYRPSDVLLTNLK